MFKTNLNQTWEQSRTTSRFSRMAWKHATKTIKKAKITSGSLEFPPRIKEPTRLPQMIGNKKEDLCIDLDSSKKEELIPKSSFQHSCKISTPNFVSYPFNITETWIKKFPRFKRRIWLKQKRNAISFRFSSKKDSCFNIQSQIQPTLIFFTKPTLN